MLPRELTKLETYQAFDLEIELRIRCIQTLEQCHPDLLKQEDEIQQCIIKDEMWQALGIEKEDYNLAVTRYKLVEDPYVL